MRTNQSFFAWANPDARSFRRCVISRGLPSVHCRSSEEGGGAVMMTVACARAPTARSPSSAAKLPACTHSAPAARSIAVFMQLTQEGCPLFLAPPRVMRSKIFGRIGRG